eukprot:TRINITY_DN15853_c0_g1_i1.p1 TRINITY_DN15853_c0_g1~~TRINITY_DN15853_c0_g1_i1.p1  ORF type:complete len:204 (-),score=23.14 TRINITY_DN15853_c0_g1_i1:154-765(-)
MCSVFFFFQAEDGIRDLVRSRGLGDVYKRQINAEYGVDLRSIMVLPIKPTSNAIADSSFRTACCCTTCSCCYCSCPDCFGCQCDYGLLCLHSRGQCTPLQCACNQACFKSCTLIKCFCSCGPLLYACACPTDDDIPCEIGLFGCMCKSREVYHAEAQIPPARNAPSGDSRSSSIPIPGELKEQAAEGCLDCGLELASLLVDAV